MRCPKYSCIADSLRTTAAVEISCVRFAGTMRSAKQQLRALSSHCDMHTIFNFLSKHCHAKAGPAACSACALTGVVAAAMEGNGSLVRQILQLWEPAGTVQTSSANGINGVACCPEETLCAASGSSISPTVAEKSSAQHPINPVGAWHLLPIDTSTDSISYYKCFERFFSNRISLFGDDPRSARLSRMTDCCMPAVLKAAALGGSVEVLHVLLEAYPRILDGAFDHPHAAPRAVSLGALHNAAAHGRVAFLTALFERDLDLRGDMDALQLAAGGGHADAVQCLLARHGASERRTAVSAGGEVHIAGAAARAGQVCACLQLADLTLEAHGIDGHRIMDRVFNTNEANLRDGLWCTLQNTCLGGSMHDLRALLGHPSMQQAFIRTPDLADCTPLTIAVWQSGCLSMLIWLCSSRPALAAAKLELLLTHPAPCQLHAKVNLHEYAKKVVQADWVEGLDVLFRVPAAGRDGEPLRANANDDELFLLACAGKRMKAAQALLDVTGKFAVNPRARRQAALRAACETNCRVVVELLLRQTGERAVRMQPGKKSFFYRALQPNAGAVRDRCTWDQNEQREIRIPASDASMDGEEGGYGVLKLLLGATGVSAVPPSMWAHGKSGVPPPTAAARGPVERQYRDVGWDGGIQRMARRDMVLLRCQDKDAVRLKPFARASGRR